MHDSTFAFTTQSGPGADTTLAWGHIDDGSHYAAIPMFLRPAGQFTTTAADLGRFAGFLMSDGVVEGEVFIREDLMRARGMPQGTGAGRAGLAAGYALGLGRRDRHGVVGYCHGGNIVGFVAMLCVFPEQQKAFAYSVNTDSETANYGRLDKLFIGALGIPEAPPPPTAEPAADISEWYGRYVLSPNRFQMFEYLDKVFGAVRIFDRGDALALASLQRETRQLRPTGGYAFSASDRTTVSHVFFRGAEQEYLVSDGFQTYEKMPALYLAAYWSSMLMGLVGMAWILIAGTIALLRHRVRMIGRSETPAFIATVLLIAPLPHFLTQSFMALGDLTPASLSLALVTLLLPIGMVSTLLIAAKTWRTSLLDLVHGTAALFVLQWCLVLVAQGMLPFRLWA